MSVYAIGVCRDVSIRRLFYLLLLSSHSSGDRIGKSLNLLDRLSWLSRVHESSEACIHAIVKYRVTMCTCRPLCSGGRTTFTTNTCVRRARLHSRIWRLSERVGPRHIAPCRAVSCVVFGFVKSLRIASLRECNPCAGIIVSSASILKLMGNCHTLMLIMYEREI